VAGNGGGKYPGVDFGRRVSMRRGTVGLDASRRRAAVAGERGENGDAARWCWR
jgi:hypothetical protein